MSFTPIAKQLQQRLEDRKAWFRNWLFQWHNLKIPGGLVEVDLFDGRKSYLGGIAFDGSTRTVFWDAITRGVRKEILEQFAWVDEQVRRYNPTAANESIDQAAGLLVAFVRSIRREAIAKDRILRGDGINFPTENDGGHWEGTSQGEIVDYANALKRALPVDTPRSTQIANPATSVGARLNQIWNENQWLHGSIGLALGLAGVLIALVAL